jgi:hypothetical protein
MFSSAGCSLSKAEGFSCSLDFFNEGLWIKKLEIASFGVEKTGFSPTVKF